jgi:two-component system sensor histidine kinase DesK
MRLLPPKNEQGWLPYGWLVYLVIFLLYPFEGHASALEWTLTIAAVCAFLPLYFWGYWLNGPRILLPIAGMTVIGCVFAPWNAGASVFFVYAGCFIGEVAEPGIGVRYLGALLGIVVLESWALNLHPWFWGPALIITALMGGVDIHYAQRRRMNRKLSMAQDEIEHLAKVAERERIARDLHDLLGHTLSIIILKSELASKIAEKDTKRAIAEIRDVERISRDALAEVRQAVKGYRSMGLSSELRHAEETLRTAGIRVECASETVPLTTAQEIAMVLALREAVTNVVRHAAATSCEISIRRSEGACELAIADNGCGGSAPEGSGLSGMRHRVESLGGTLDRDSTRGTRLIIRVPIQNIQSIGAA